jgi:hypothetical protein
MIWDGRPRKPLVCRLRCQINITLSRTQHFSICSRWNLNCPKCWGLPRLQEWKTIDGTWCPVLAVSHVPLPCVHAIARGGYWIPGPPSFSWWVWLMGAPAWVILGNFTSSIQCEVTDGQDRLSEESRVFTLAFDSLWVKLASERGSEPHDHRRCLAPSLPRLLSK